MSPRPLLVLTAVVVGLELALSAWAVTQVATDALVPIHWGIGGEADGYAQAWIALSLLPGLTAFVGLLLAWVPRFDPRREHLERSATAYRWIAGSAVVLLGGLHLLVVLAALGSGIEVVRYIGFGVGALFAIVGNFLGKTRSSWFLGIRTPWTLSSERSWQRTHRIGGYLLLAVGAAAALTALALPVTWFFWVLMVGLLGSTAFLVAYSYVAWRDDPEREQPDPAADA